MLKRFFKNEQGVAAVEFSLTIAFFIAMVLLIVELSRMAILSAALDLTVAGSVKQTKNIKSTDYFSEVESRFKEQLGVWDFLDKSNGFVIEVEYAANAAALIKNSTQKTPDSDHPLAQYTVGYKYEPMFIWYPKILELGKHIDPIVFTRRVVVTQEYERKRQ